MGVGYSWNIDPREFMKTVKADTRTKTLEVAEAVFDGVVDRSPVRTGSFRASWNATVGSPDTSTVVGGSPEDPLSPPSFPDLSMSKDQPQKVYVTNDTPYGKELEDGSSSQAPNGMVELTLASLR